MNNPIYHARLQKWFRRNADLQCSNVVGLPDGAGDIAIPTTAFNVVYQLTHLYHHFFDEGIGMRQIIDYFLVVNDFSKNVFLNNKSSKITPSLFFDKASCTRQFESELSLHSLASLFPLKEGSTSHPQGRGRKPLLLVVRNRYALRLADQSGLRQIVRDGTAGRGKFTVNSLQFTTYIRGILLIYCEFLGVVICR